MKEEKKNRSVKRQLIVIEHRTNHSCPICFANKINLSTQLPTAFNKTDY